MKISPPKFWRRPWFFVSCGGLAALAVASTPWLCEFLNNPFLIDATSAKSFGNAKTPVFFMNFLILPFTAIVMSCFQRIRLFQIGFILGAGIAWMVMFSLCWQKYM